jgi:TolB-like protein
LGISGKNAYRRKTKNVKVNDRLISFIDDVLYGQEEIQKSFYSGDLFALQTDITGLPSDNFRF